MVVEGICELVLESGHPKELERFYLDLGLSPLARDDGKLWLAAGERARLGIWEPGTHEHDDRGGRHVHFAFSVPAGTIERVAERMRGAGHQVEGPVAHDGGDRSLYLSDPEGNRVELWDLFHQEHGAEHGVQVTAG
jgi:catechol-2,3-dioxygenase